MDQLVNNNEEPSADEWFLVLAYRRCGVERKAILRTFANLLASEDSQADAQVIIFPIKDSGS